MWKKLKKLLFISLFAYYCLAAAFAQEDTFDLEYWNQIAAELTTPTLSSPVQSTDLDLNLTLGLPSVMTISSDSTQLNLDSMDVWELFDLCDEKVTSLQLRVETLSLYSKSLEDAIVPLMNDVSSLKTDLTKTRNALISNKADTENALALAGEFYEEVQNLEERVAYLQKKEKNFSVYANIVTPLPGAILMTEGFIQMGNGDVDKGWNKFFSGCILTVCMELAYQYGHYILGWF